MQLVQVGEDELDADNQPAQPHHLVGAGEERHALPPQLLQPLQEARPVGRARDTSYTGKRLYLIYQAVANYLVGNPSTSIAG